MLTASQILEVWEQGRAQTPVQRAFSLLTFALPGHSPQDLENCGIGRRDRELLTLRGRIFGSRLASSAKCPACGELVEVDFAAADIQVPSSASPAQPPAFRSGEFELHFRLPTCGDLASLNPKASIMDQRKALLHSCIIEVRRNGVQASAELVPESVAIELSAHMAEIDPQGDIQLSLVCPKCDRRWDAVLDIASYLWSEINAWALRTLREIDVLATAYGWTETEILRLSPWRRQAYLEIIQS